MLRSRGKELVFVWNPIILCAIIKGIIKSEHLQKGTDSCKNTRLQQLGFFVNLRTIAEGGKLHPAQLCSSCAGDFSIFPLLV